jgi:hypothetical protein
VTEIRGAVSKKQVAAGSKSEHAAVVLVTAEGGEYTLRLRGGNAFRDPKLDALIGKHIRGAGDVVSGATFIMDEWSEE